MLFVETHHILLNLFTARIRRFKLLVLILEPSHLRLDLLNLQHRNLLFQPQRKQDDIECDSQEDDCPTEISDVAMNPQEAENEWPGNEFEISVIDDRSQLRIRLTEPIPLFGSDVNPNRFSFGNLHGHR